MPRRAGQITYLNAEGNDDAYLLYQRSDVGGEVDVIHGLNLDDNLPKPNQNLELCEKRQATKKLVAFVDPLSKSAT